MAKSQSQTFISRAGIKNLQDKIEEKRAELSRQRDQMNAQTQADRNLPENSGYHESMVRATFTLPDDIRRLVDILACAQPIEETPQYLQLAPGDIWLGCRVTLKNLSASQEEVWTILGPTECNLETNAISCNSDMARTLIGRSVSQQFEFRGEHFEIIHVEKVL